METRKAGLRGRSLRNLNGGRIRIFQFRLPQMDFWREKVIQPALDRDVNAARAEQRAILERDPGNAPAHFALGTLSHFQGQTDAAIDFFLRAIKLDPAYAAPHASLGRIYAVQGLYDLAWQHAREAERLGDPSLVQQLERYSSLGNRQAGEKHQQD